MLCSDCKCDLATEFRNEFGKAVAKGTCRPCYERAVRRVVINDDAMPLRGWTFLSHRLKRLKSRT